MSFVFFFQAEDGIRDLVRSRGLGDVYKRQGIDTAGVTFVPADFEQEDWLAQLVRAGFDPHRPALFLWEGVIVYLDRAAVEETLRKIAGTAPVSYTHLRAHETVLDLVCRLLLEKKKLR